MKKNTSAFLLVIISMVYVNGSVASSLCLEGEFDDQVKQLLDSQMLTKDEIDNVTSVLTVLEEIFRKIWPGSKVIPQGSLTTGLGMKFSDVDGVLIIPGYNEHNKTANLPLILRVEKTLKRLPHLFDKVETQFNRTYIYLTSFKYVPTQKDSHLDFSSTSEFKLNRYIPFYYSLDERAHTLAAIVKFWSVTHETLLAGKLNSYNLNLLTIFYLQQENIVPPVYVLKQADAGEILIGDWKPRFNNTKGMYELLGGFFKYYSEFDFDKYVVSPVIGRPILKTDFLDIDSLPDELSLYKKNMKLRHQEHITSVPKMAIQDIFSRISIENSAISPELADKFQSDVDYAAVMFDRSPSEYFLASILVKDERNEETDLLDDVEECLSATPWPA